MSKGSIVALIVVIVLIVAGLIYWYSTQNSSYGNSGVYQQQPAPSVSATGSVNVNGGASY